MSQEYTLDFYQALKVLENNEGWIQGEGFGDGVVLSMQGGERLCVVDFYPCYSKAVSDYTITSSTFTQKYRIVTTQPDSLRK